MISMTKKPGRLAVVATPIGNLADLSQRAALVIKEADILACEDTRVTRKLLRLSGHQTEAKFISYNDHNGIRVRPKLLASIAKGLDVALVCDAGTPLISDPGYKLVKAAHENEFQVTPIPGPSAVLAGITCSGLPSHQFLFAGFIPNNKKSAEKAFKEFAHLSITSVWFDSPRRITANLAIMTKVFGSRFAVIGRELTKLHEEFYRAPLDELANLFANKKPPIGELVIVVEGANEIQPKFKESTLKNMLLSEMHSSSLRDAVSLVAEKSGHSRRKVYQLAINLLE